MNMATPTKAPPTKDGTRTPTQTRNQITVEQVFHNHIDLKTGQPAYGRWMMAVWQKELRRAQAQLFHVTVEIIPEQVANKKDTIVNYGRKARLTGSRTGIDQLMKEYDRESSAIHFAARHAYAAAATAEAAKEEKTVLKFNPEAQDWAPYWNSYGLGAVKTYMVEHKLATDSLPKPKHPGIATVGERYKTQVIPTAPKPAPKEAAPKPEAQKSTAKKPTASKGATRRHERQQKQASTPKPEEQPQPIADVLAQHTEEGQEQPEGAKEEVPA